MVSNRWLSIYVDGMSRRSAPAASGLALVLSFSLATACRAADATTTAADGISARYESRDQHDPNGIGKFYLGREIGRSPTRNSRPDPSILC